MNKGKAILIGGIVLVVLAFAFAFNKMQDEGLKDFAAQPHPVATHTPVLNQDQIVNGIGNQF